MQFTLNHYYPHGAVMQKEVVLLPPQVPTFVKWAGGKKQLLSQLVELFPSSFNRYFEPFVGGGAVLFSIAQMNPTIPLFASDVNSELIEAYKAVRDAPAELVKELAKHQNKHSKEYYYAVRAQNVSKLSPLQRSARFIYLNRTCFNGLHRVNSKGNFNVPIGSYKNPDVAQAQKIPVMSKLLKNVQLNSASFEHILKTAKAGDFIYFDPPYYPLDRKPSFTKYAQGDFLEKEQTRLAEVFKMLDERGCFCMLSNSDTAFIRRLYVNYDIHTVKAKRLINSKAEGRGFVNEVVVTNY